MFAVLRVAIIIKKNALSETCLKLINSRDLFRKNLPVNTYMTSVVTIFSAQKYNEVTNFRFQILK